jgi:phosphoadenosine phosphosulfate reductase
MFSATRRFVTLTYAIGSLDRIERAAARFDGAAPQEIIEWALDEFDERLTIATGFGAEGMALVDMAARTGRPFDLFFLDTGFLFPETYELRRRVEDRYQIKIRAVNPELSPEQQEGLYGPELWARDPDLCCRIRKLEPLSEALRDRDAWVTAIRRDQTAERASAREVEWDSRWQLVKINPLARWTKRDVWGYVAQNDVPYNPMHDAGYPSIGCTHCTRTIREGEDERAGRWSGRAKTECGLHGSSGQNDAAA